MATLSYDGTKAECQTGLLQWHNYYEWKWKNSLLVREMTRVPQPATDRAHIIKGCLNVTTRAEVWRLNLRLSEHAICTL